MRNFKVFSSLIVIFLFTKSINSQDCNECVLETGFACFSDHQYFLCDSEGLDIFSLTTCTTGICDSTVAGSSPCSETSAPVCPVPPILIKPPATTTTTSTTTTTTTPTTTTTTPTTTTTTPTTTTTTPTTTTTTATTTTRKPFDPTVFCLIKAIIGRFVHPEIRTCDQFVYCYENSGYKGAVYFCTGKNLFDPFRNACALNYTCPTIADETTTLSSSDTTTTILTGAATTVSSGTSTEVSSGEVTKAASGESSGEVTISTSKEVTNASGETTKYCECA